MYNQYIYYFWAVPDYLLVNEWQWIPVRLRAPPHCPYSAVPRLGGGVALFGSVIPTSLALNRITEHDHFATR